MQSKEFNQLQRDERSRDRKKKTESFWRAFLLTENGKVKSTLLLNSFCLSVVYFAVYFAAYAFLVEPLHGLVGGASTLVVNLVESMAPAAVGTAICGLTWLLREKRLMLATYLWLTLLAVVCLITLMVLLPDGQSRLLCLQFFVLFVPAPLLLGGGLAAFLYLRYRKRTAPPASAEF